MLSIKAREAADTIFKVYGMIQLSIKPSLTCFTGERSNHAQGLNNKDNVTFRCLIQCTPTF